MQVVRLDQKSRIIEKQASRERDSELLQAGLVSKDQLRNENSLFSSLDMSSFHIASVGKRVIRSAVA